MTGSGNDGTIALALVLVAIGVLTLIANIGIFHINLDLLRYWPGILVYFGVCNLLKYFFGYSENQ